MGKKQNYNVLLDTSFFIRLLDRNNPLHKNALGYYKYFLDNEVGMVISTVSIAEYCVKGDITDLPLLNLRIVPFNFHHATKAGEITRILYQARNDNKLHVESWLIIPNDSKLFAQAAIEVDVKYFVTSDSKSKKVIDVINDNQEMQFTNLDINMPHEQKFGILF